LGLTGSYVLTPTVFDAIRKTKPGKGGEVQLTDALRVLLKSEPIFAYRFIGRRYDIGTKLDWFRAHVELTLQNKEFKSAGEQFLRELLKHD
jgi:UTP--glucose-1-phosphate uridylyltransferase